MVGHANEVLQLCGLIPVCSGGGVTVGGCGVRCISGTVESEMREGGEGSSTGYGCDAVMGVGKYEEVGPGVTCEYTVGVGTL